ncbi:MAG: hypothetical protein R3284_05885, partial [Rubricoccaceae bacterium]|nr:hypothetical protein [Rubricoccaceae bacterium]
MRWTRTSLNRRGVMEGPNHGGAGISVTSILIILFSLGAVYWEMPPLKGSRPQENPLSLPDLQQGEAHARLWQDPFSAVTAHEQRLASETETQSGGKEQVASVRWVTDRGPCIDLRENAFTIGVAVFGGRYFESIESRRRTRYAVVSALASRGYYPDDYKRIRYLMVPKGADSDPFPRILPYESFRTSTDAAGEPEFAKTDTASETEPTSTNTAGDDEAPQQIFVLWFDDDWIAASSIADFADVSGRVLDHECPTERAREARTQPFEEERRSRRYYWRVGTPNVNSVTVPSAGSEPKRTSPKHLFLLGPAGSSSFKDLLETEQGSTSPTEWPVRIFSYSATASEAGLLDTVSQVRRNAEDEPDTGAYLEPHELWRTIVTDDKLAEAMIDELASRKINPFKPSDRVVLISEMDTLYAQALPRAFETTLCNKWDKLPDWTRLKLDENDNCRAWVGRDLIRVSYLRGMDGQIATGTSLKGSNEASSKDSGNKQPNAESTPSSATPTGRHQFDYLLRLARSLKDRDEELKRRDQSIKAIGILGSDVYDKLLVLRALRPLFPKTIFFTTDLDAILFNDEQIEWTRNLVVVSSFGLSLPEKLQGGVPPFRDSYQTSAFLSTLFAIKGVDGLVREPGVTFSPENLKDYLIPHIFEIGRGGAYQLPHALPAEQWPDQSGHRLVEPTISISDRKVSSAWPTSMGKATHTAFRLTPLDQKPVKSPFYTNPPSPKDAAREVAKVAIIGLLFILFVRALVRNQSLFVTLPKSIAAKSWSPTHWTFVVVSILIMTAFVVLMTIWMMEGFVEERLHWSAGISIWPTELIRLVCVFLSLWLIYQCWTKQGKSESNIAEDYRLEAPSKNDESGESSRLGSSEHDGDPSQEKDSLKAWLGRPWELIDPRKITDAVAKKKQPTSDQRAEMIDVADAWRRYRRKRSLLFTLIRVAVAVVVFYAFGYIIIYLFGRPHVPARGSISFIFDKAIILTMVPCFLALTFLVADVTKRSSELCTLLGESRNRWPPATLERLGHDEGTDPGYLSEWIDVRFVARLTEQVSYFIYYPFVVLFLIVISRLDLFDSWDTSWSLGIIFLASGLCAIGNAIILE